VRDGERVGERRRESERRSSRRNFTSRRISDVYTYSIYIYKHRIRVRRPMVNCPGNCGTLLYISDRQPSPHTISTHIHCTGTLHTALAENVRRRRRRRRSRRILYIHTYYNIYIYIVRVSLYITIVYRYI